MGLSSRWSVEQARHQHKHSAASTGQQVVVFGEIRWSAAVTPAEYGITAGCGNAWVVGEEMKKPRVAGTLGEQASVGCAMTWTRGNVGSVVLGVRGSCDGSVTRCSWVVGEASIAWV